MKHTTTGRNSSFVTVSNALAPRGCKSRCKPECPNACLQTKEEITSDASYQRSAFQSASMTYHWRQSVSLRRMVLRSLEEITEELRDRYRRDVFGNIICLRSGDASVSNKLSCHPATPTEATRFLMSRHNEFQHAPKVVAATPSTSQHRSSTGPKRYIRDRPGMSVLRFWYLLDLST